MNVRELAKIVGLSSATVSRSLRGDPRVSPSTHAKVIEAAQKFGYEPNPLIGRMMSTLRRRNIQTFRGNLALLVRDSRPGLLTDHRCNEVVEGAMERAKTLGFSLDRINIEEMSGKALERILHSRGIEGVIVFMPSFGGQKVTLELNFSEYSCVSAGWGLWQPEIDSVKVNYHQHIRLLLENTAPTFGDGIAAIWDFPTDAASHQMARSAFLTHHPGGVSKAEKLFLSREGISRDRLVRIVERHRVSCLILGSSYTPPAWLAEVVPATNWVWCRNPGPVPHFGRIDPQNRLLGQWAVNLVAAKIQMHETGIPENRQSVLVPAVWRSGTGA